MLGIDTPSSVTAGQDLTLVAQGGGVTVTDSSLTATAGQNTPPGVSITADAGDVTLDAATVTATADSVTASASANIIERNSSLVTAGQNVSLTAHAGDLTLSDSALLAGATFTGSASVDVIIETDSAAGASAISLSSGRDTSLITGSSLDATGTGAVEGLLATVGRDVLVDATALATSASTLTIDGGQANGAADTITLLGTFTAPLIEIHGGNGGDMFLLQPVAIIGYTQLWGGSGSDTITLHLPTIDLAHKLDPTQCPNGQTSCPAALVNGTAAEAALGRTRTILRASPGWPTATSSTSTGRAATTLHRRSSPAPRLTPPAPTTSSTSTTTTAAAHRATSTR